MSNKLISYETLEKILIKISGLLRAKADIAHTHSEYITEHQDISNLATTTEVEVLQGVVNDLLARIQELENQIFVTVKPEGEVAILTHITATYVGGDVPVGTNKYNLTGLTVTAHYSNGTSSNVTNYTLTGSISEGGNTILVSYEGKSTSFEVNGIVTNVEPEEPIMYTLTINPTPSDATVKINNVAQKSITVESGTNVTWEVSKTGYTTQTGNKVVNANETMAITLEEVASGGDSEVVTIATLEDFTNKNVLLRYTGVAEESKPSYHCTDYINVASYSSVTCDMLPKSASNSPVCWYDADKNFISGVRLDTDTENPPIEDYNAQAILTYVVPENAVYARFGTYAKLISGTTEFIADYYATITGTLK